MEHKEHLLRLRQRQGLSQQALAQQIGVSRQTVSNWENGVSVPSSENLIGLSRVYGITVEELYQDGAAQDKEVAREETPPAARDAPEVTEPKTKRPRKHRWVILTVIFCGGMLLWGVLTNSKATATVLLLLLGTIALICWLLYNLKKLFAKLLQREDEK